MFNYRYIRNIITAAAVTAVLPATAAAPTGIANVFGATSWETMQNPPYGVYTFPFEAGSTPELIGPAVVPANFGAVRVGDRFFVIEGIATTQSSFITNYLYDINTWAKITDFRGENVTAFDMAWDERTDIVYGYFHNFDTGAEFFGTINIDTGKTAVISTLPYTVRALSFDNSNTLYAISDTGKLFTIDIADGQTTVIGETGCASKWTTSGAIDNGTDTFYFVACNDSESAAYSIDLATAQATRLFKVYDDMEIAGLFFKESTAKPDAPAAAAIDFLFNEDSLSGEIKFTMPNTTFGGATLSGSISYRAYFDGEELGSGTATPGEALTFPVSVTKAGEYKATLIASNTAGAAPTASVTKWVGADIPAAPSYVNLSYDNNGTFTLEWDEVGALHGGWFDPATLTYTVTRYGDTEKVFSGLTSTSFSDTVTLPYEDEYATYHYSVKALFGTVAGSSTSSEYYTIGSSTPPFAENFPNRWALGKFTIFQGENEDNERWSYDSNAVTITTNTKTGGDDYLLLPPLELEYGMKYGIAFDVKGKYASDTETIEVLAGDAPAIDRLTATVMEPTDFSGTEYRTMTCDFEPATSGVYFIALHALSKPWSGAITVDNIKVLAGVPVNTGIDSTGEDALCVEISRGALSVNAPMGPVTVYDLTGQKIAAAAGSSLSINLGAGMYIIRAGEVSQKVIIP